MNLYMMISMHKGISQRLLAILFLIIVSGCVEPFEIETNNFESILVINTTITDEMKNQQILLSRTFKAEEEIDSRERNASVIIRDNNGIEYNFEEVDPGKYISEQEFSAVPGREYQLFINTQDGRSYISDKAILPQQTSIENVYPVRMFNNNGEEGVGILVDSFDPTGNSVYYRYEYEESYRIRAPFWVPVDLNSVSFDVVFDFEFSERSERQRICYNNGFSSNINVTNTTAVAEDRVTGHQVRFIDALDIRVADRYSILVRQFVQSREANGFYQTLASFSESESLFSQVQPGFINGNIVSAIDSNERVLGFFNVSSVSTKRIFFNREDIIGDLPRFNPGCDRISPIPEPDESFEEFAGRLQALINTGRVKFLEENRMPVSGEGPLVFMDRPCGDCTAFGRSDPPAFWVD
ncbi:DUF4249 domain-containing protein [Aquimarina sp. MMG016]|uniref:DUF4249 domain-containing protein n=1 Tax=Aquimarina sp. MMG016 TaxID=2822690 RepID=UPI001B39D895|nr:DUF4249 domain-containing protein [Aquimarina sp. MMG016]MBQ4821839.1 DUF4249 domain-containing protein [Aquimarina sp. MMG016]